MPVTYPYKSLEDFLIANELTVDGTLDDGWGASFPVKGREIKASVLFADISSFSARTVDLNPTETLAYVNNFFAWITAEALRGRPGIVDKYIGDELMVVFSTEFGSEDPFLDAVQAARAMGENDALNFSPHIGIATGEVIIGYVGTPLRFDCSVFGTPVALAARCGGVSPSCDDGRMHSTTIAFPDSDWGDRDFDEVFPSNRYRNPDGSTGERPHGWELLPAREEELKNLPNVEVRQIINRAIRMMNWTVEDRTREGVAALKGTGHYRPRD